MGLRCEKFKELTPEFIGKSLEDAAKLAGCTSGSLRARFSREGYEVRIRRSKETGEFVIEELDFCGIKIRKKNEIGLETNSETKTDRPAPLFYKAPTRIVVSDAQYLELVREVRRKY